MRREFHDRLKRLLIGKVVIVGIGNSLRGDDALGPLLVERLKERVKVPCIDAGRSLENYIGKILKEEPMYAYEINKHIQRQFGFSTATITVYVVLYKMLREELIQIDKEKIMFGRPERKYYTITDKGRYEYQEGVQFLEEILLKLG